MINHVEPIHIIASLFVNVQSVISSNIWQRCPLHLDDRATVLFRLLASVLSSTEEPIYNTM